MVRLFWLTMPISNLILFAMNNLSTMNAPVLKNTQNKTESMPQNHIKKLGGNLSLFLKKTADGWIEEAKKRPIPKMLFGELWFEGELCILFADTGMGKSILAVQISNSIATGVAVKPFALEAEPQPVLYFDFELSDKQFENRYSDEYKDHFKFHPNFFRLEINREFEVPEGATFEFLITFHMEMQIIETGAKILVIDNLTFLSHDTEKAKDALILMKQLQRLKKKYGLSLLVLGHTPKIEPHRPITKNHIAGSKMISNFIDSSFAIGESFNSNGVRYLKQIKERNCEKIYHSENVPIFELEKKDSFLHFRFLNHSTEKEHLRPLEKNEKEGLKDTVESLHNEGRSIREIVVEIRGKVSKSTIQRWIKEDFLPLN